MERAGELAALGTACCWVVSAVAFEAAGKRIGSLSLNVIRLTLALVPLCLWGFFSRGHALPLDAAPSAWAWLALSGLVGFTFGDLCLFRAFVLLGPRLATLIMASVPVWTSLFGFVFLGERLLAREVLGVSLTVAGIAWAVSQRKPPATVQANQSGDPSDPSDQGQTGLAVSRWRFANSGIVLAIGGALGQAVGLVLSKHGMADYDPFAATQIRVFAGIAGFSLVVTLWRWWPRVGAAVRDVKAMGPATIGAVFGPFLGVGLSLLAVQLAPTGVASSVMATTPVLMLPVSWLRGEKFGWAGALGAVIAVAGVALLFTVERP